jgi:hypothetical protein
MSKQSSSDTSNISLLLAAIQHLKLQYLCSPNSCLQISISRNYNLLLNCNAPLQELNEWRQQQQRWQSFYRDSQLKSRHRLLPQKTLHLA